MPPRGSIGAARSLISHSYCDPATSFTLHAFACAIEHAARHPAQHVFYADEIERDEQGGLLPRLKPDWSPLLQAARPYVGRAVFARVDFVRGRSLEPRSDDLSAAIGAPDALPAEAIGHLRRMLLTATGEAEGFASPPLAPAEPDPCWPAPAAVPPSASIIIPTRDRGDLLDRCVQSIFAAHSEAEYRIVIVDNGSVTPATQAVLARLRGDERVTVLSQAGPFNFAGLCNAGAAAGQQPILVFLNDDTRIHSPDWLLRLSAAATRPDIGAVGRETALPRWSPSACRGIARDRRDGGPFRRRSRSRGGPAGSAATQSVHETSAVTGACLAVERRKFEAVGGFDSANLPVELNDVDLCLRLAEKGWKSICLSQVSLFHEESASRGGAKFRLLKVHHEERAHFVRRWRTVIRDDPFFHPAFSLFKRQPALG